MLDDLGSLITDLEKSGRKVMLVVVPEHGAAEKGDKVQVAHLRDISEPGHYTCASFGEIHRRNARRQPGYRRY